MSPADSGRAWRTVLTSIWKRRMLCQLKSNTDTAGHCSMSKHSNVLSKHNLHYGSEYWLMNEQWLHDQNDKWALYSYGKGSQKNKTCSEDWKRWNQGDVLRWTVPGTTGNDQKWQVNDGKEASVADDQQHWSQTLMLSHTKQLL